jgi:hypothetical protein
MTDPRDNWGKLTKREYFAGLALQGTLAGSDYLADKDVSGGLTAAIAAQDAVWMADALIAELNREKP